MRTILLAGFLTSAVFAQATFTLPAVAGNESSLTVTESAAAIPNVIAHIQATVPVPGLFPNPGAVPLATTLAVAITSTSTTTVVLTNGANLALCNGLQIDSETMQVVSVVGNTATVLRALIGTTAATHFFGAPVTMLRTGGGTCLLKAMIADGIMSVVREQLQGAALTTQTAAIAAANASIAATVAAAVQ